MGAKITLHPTPLFTLLFSVTSEVCSLRTVNNIWVFIERFYNIVQFCVRS